MEAVISMLKAYAGAVRSLTWDEVRSQRLARRYLTAYWPATHREFRQWSSSRSFRPEDAARVFADLDLDLVEVDVEGHIDYLLEDEEPTSEASSVRPLPEYDAYVTASASATSSCRRPCGSRSLPTATAATRAPRARRFPRRRRLRGHLEPEEDRENCELAVRPARKLTRSERTGVEREGERIGVFLGLGTSLDISPPGP